MQEVVGRILEHYNKGEKEEAKKLLMLSSWILPQSTKDYLLSKINGTIPQKELEFLKEACEIMGPGSKLIHNGTVIYENKNTKEGEAGTQNTK